MMPPAPSAAAAALNMIKDTEILRWTLDTMQLHFFFK